MRFKKARRIDDKVSAYSSEEMLPNEGWVLEANKQINAAIDSTGKAIQQGVEHVFQSSRGGLTTATAGAIGMYTGGGGGALVGVVVERSLECFHCHVGQPIYDAMKEEGQ